MAAISADDAAFQAKIERALATAKSWDSDTSVLKQCRASIPLDKLRDDFGEYAKESDRGYRGKALFLKRLTLYFKSIMTWVNAPPCENCGNAETNYKATAEPESDEEKKGQASRVEVYSCSKCNSITRFPRYNSTLKLLETKRGRCGEYANLFGQFCRACGFETRYILDVTDHVWVEAWCGVDEGWIMADSCEGVIDKPSMYEAGWQKKLSIQIAAAKDHVQDVSLRYTRQWNDDDFQARRRALVSSESAYQQILQRVNQTLKIGLSDSRREELERRDKQEESDFSRAKQSTKWEETEKYGKGRISGSLAWKLRRQEAGTDAIDGNADGNGEKVVSQFKIQSFLPLDSPIGTCQISVSPKPIQRHDGIVVSGAACAIGETNTVSVVVVDENASGCILQSCSFSSVSELGDFCVTIPKARIVILQGSLSNVGEISMDVGEKLSLLGGFDPSLIEKGVLYIGQIEHHPDWTFCSSFDDAPNGHQVGLQLNATFSLEDCKLRTERNAIPNCIATRLPESAMPLKTQLLATEQQKRLAFLSFIRRTHSKRYAGYTTKPNSPVYLIDGSGYPIRQLETAQESSWNTFRLLPPVLVPQDDVGIQEASEKILPKFEIPIDSKFFSELLGEQLLVKDAGGVPVRMDTSTALFNRRLVALYFSAHWCGPCRQFTPMLSEMYAHLKDTFPSHGLEIVFVSSDRDQSSFDRYFGTMPWLSIPFESLAFLKHGLSMRYGIQGIPALVVLDAMSGAPVVSIHESRKEVMQACRGGDESIEKMLQSWFDRIPSESKSIMEMLALSCADDKVDDKEAESDPQNPYLIRTENPLDMASRVKIAHSELVKEGMNANEAAAKALDIVVSKKQNLMGRKFEAGTLNERTVNSGPLDTSISLKRQKIDNIAKWNSESDVCTVLQTARKYIENVKKEPWNPTFRSFKVSNKVADRITRIEGGLDLLKNLGFDVLGSARDFTAEIPLGADILQMATDTQMLLEQAP